MTKLQKAALTVDGNDLHLSMPFAKVNKQKRTVSGFATLDNIDSQGDVVTAEASAKAFARARGNLREMHDKIAVGRIVDFKEDEYFDTEENKFYRGMYVTAYISKGAESTWEKVLDGTLSGFSIGGEIIDASTEFVKDADKSVRFIKDYDLVELSLVDNPANQLANVFSIQKAANGSVNSITGMVADVEVENVFYCEKDSVIQAKSSESVNCPECGERMELAGWFENTGNRAEKVKSVMANFLAVNKSANSEEGGVEVAKENENVDESVATGHEAGDPSEVPTQENRAADVDEVDETAGTENEEPAEDVEEVPDETEELSKRIDSLKDDLKTIFTDSLEKSREETIKHVRDLESNIEDFKKSVEEKISELDSRYEEFGKSLEVTKGKLAAMEDSLEKFNSSEALRKSADLDDEPAVKVQKPKSAWNGAFSIDNVLR